MLNVVQASSQFPDLCPPSPFLIVNPYFRSLWVFLILILLSSALFINYFGPGIANITTDYNRPRIFVNRNSSHPISTTSQPVSSTVGYSQSVEHTTYNNGRGQQTQNITNSCSQPVRKIAFMKTHKTASSTVQNILMR